MIKHLLHLLSSLAQHLVQPLRRLVFFKAQGSGKSGSRKRLSIAESYQQQPLHIHHRYRKPYLYHANIEKLASQEIGSDSLGPQDQGLAETHSTANYPIVHPETHFDIASFDPNHNRCLPKELRVIHSFDGPSFSRYKISAKLAANYLSFASEADFISYANNVLSGIVGPAIDVFVSDNFTEKIREYDHSSFACGANVGNKELNEHLSKLDKLEFHGEASYSQSALCTGDILTFYLLYPKWRDWFDAFATLITEPKLLPSIGAGFYEDRKEVFIIAYALQILLFAPIQWHQGARYKRTDSYPRRFPLGYPEPGPDDVTVCGKYSLDDLYRAVVLMFFLIEQRSGEGEDPDVTQTSEVWLGYTTVRCHHPWSHRQSNGRLTSSSQIDVSGSCPSIPVIFHINLKADILRIFHIDQELPIFKDKNGFCAPLPVRRLQLFEANFRYFNPQGTLESFCNSSVSCSPGLMLDKLPKLEEYSLIIPAAKQSWTMDGLPRIRPQDDNETPAHIGTKWQFNFYRYHRLSELHNEVPEGCLMGVPPNFCDDSHLDGTDPSDRPGSIPYIGKYGYERSHGIVGGLWAGFKYFQQSKEAYFAPLSWTEVEPLVMGNYGENGTRALFHNHTPQFVSKVCVVRQGTAAPKGWIKVRAVDESDPAWRHQLLKTWNAVRYTLEEIQNSGSRGPYTLCQR
ncbi:hypothetical protein FMEXI_7172 [Fusarium mexicanum]|uniref:Uncharacterized protein n=1 Tax=Fusarium mexicanum TaxID=751941 RepID=A0A8H5MUT4_9HYPO|nr:hypothetical protein FMEXI_7172 [Fusarium mexicanum]